MAIVKMIGKVYGNEIIFRKDGSGYWTATVPKDINGEFVVEVTAYDEAGNEAYNTSMLFLVDASALNMRIIPLSFAYRLSESNHQQQLTISKYAYYASSNFKHEEVPIKFTVRVV